MYQMVFVVNDKYAQRIIGVYNEFPDALKAAKDYTKGNYTGYEISITPVTVDLDNGANGARGYCLNEQEVMDAVQDEMDVAYDDWLNTGDEADYKDETEDEAEYADEDEDEDENEDADEAEAEEDEELTDEEVDDLIGDAVDEIAELIGDVIRRVTGR